MLVQLEKKITNMACFKGLPGEGLSLPKFNLNKPQNFWNNVLWTDGHLILDNSSTGGRVINWACFVAPVHLVVIKSTMSKTVSSGNQKYFNV